jgi:hypothetical protein
MIRTCSFLCIHFRTCLCFFAETFEGRRAEHIERYTETPRRSSERSEREHIEADAGEDTKTTTKMRKRKNKTKNNKHGIETHTWLRGTEEGDSHIVSKLLLQPNLNLNILERPDER